MLRKITRGLEERFMRRAAAANRARVMARYIGVTGSSGKTTTCGLLAHILATHGKTYRQIFNNSEKFLFDALAKLKADSAYCIAEVGARAPGYMQPMAQLLSPDLAIVTMVELEHHSAFRSREAVAQEKSTLAEAVGRDGVVVLNADDPFTPVIAEKVRGRTVTFGWGERADYKVVGVELAQTGFIEVSIQSRRGIFTIIAPFVFKTFWVSVAAAFAASCELGVEPDIAIERIRTFQPSQNRCGVLEIDNGPAFILDTAKAPFHSVEASLEAFRDLKGVRKRVVLGTIADYKGSGSPKYRRAVQAASKGFDEMVIVGEGGSHSVVAAAEKLGLKLVQFDSTMQADAYIRQTAIAGEIIYLKGSQNFHLERIALSWSESVRCWEDKCGRGPSCFECGRYGVPFEQQKGVLAKRRRKQAPEAFRAGYVE